MQKNNTPLNTAQWLVLSTLFILCYWPTYFILSVEPAVMQKSHFIIMLGYLLVVTFATRTSLKVPNIAFIYLLPLVAMLSSFLFNIPDFKAFHISVLVKPILLFFYVIFFYSLFCAHFCDKTTTNIKSALNVIFYLQLVVIVLQITFGDIPPLKILSFKDVYTGFGFRAPGTFDWVYVTCYFFNFYLAYYLIDFYLTKRKKKAAFLIILSLLVIFLSQSKTGYLATAFIALYFVFLSALLKLNIAKKIIITILITIALIASLIIYLGINLDYITTFIELIQQGKLDGSTSTRKQQTLIALSEGLTYWYSGSPLALKGYIIENSYLDYLFRYGLMGLIVFMLMVTIFYFYSLQTCINCKRLFDKGFIKYETLQLSIACHISTLAAPIYSFTGTPIDGYRSAIWSCLIIAMIGFINSVTKNSKDLSRLPTTKNFSDTKKING
ncbi:hypothetical protein V6237_10155 [Pseudoalteromonas carrageenovora]|uniref:hypothetical protein n=1 Tax=Pseudoalteromonas carrageenovora TaxID=227 RepID=UPI003120078C